MAVALPLLPAWSRWLGVALIAGIILYASVLAPPPAIVFEHDGGSPSLSVGPDPGGDTADGGMEVFDLLAEAIGFASNQWRHFLAYAALAYATAYAIAHRRQPLPVHFVLVIASVLLYGATIEMLQHLFTHRTVALSDILINGLGASLVFGWYAIQPWIEWQPIGSSGRRIPS